MGVYQEESYFITEEFTDEQVIKVKEYLNHNQPICTEADWWDNELTLRNFDSQSAAEYFYKGLCEYMEE